MAPPVAQTQRCFGHVNRGRNGCDVQLDQLGEQLIAPTHQKKRRFVPEEGLTLENNDLAPAPKRRRAKVFLPPLLFCLLTERCNLEGMHRSASTTTYNSATSAAVRVMPANSLASLEVQCMGKEEGIFCWKVRFLKKISDC